MIGVVLSVNVSVLVSDYRIVMNDMSVMIVDSRLSDSVSVVVVNDWRLLVICWLGLLVRWLCLIW